MPRKEELIQRYMEDGQHEQALAMAAQSAPPASSDANEKPSEAVPAPKEKTALEALRENLSAGSGGGASTTASAAGTLAAIERAGDAKACLELVHELGSHLPREQSEHVFVAMARSALAQDNPSLAADICREAVANNGAQSPELLGLLLQSSRWSGQSASALAIFDKLSAAGALPRDLRSGHMALLREGNQPARALDLALAQLEEEKATGDGMKLESVLLASEIAGNAGQMGRVIPVIGQFLDAAPQGKLTLEQLAAAKSAPENAQWVGVARTVAQHCEWGGQPGKAFDLYMKLAVCGEVPALDRLLALNPGLNRDGDLLAVLRLVAPVKGRPELQRQLAKMCGEAAEYDEAEENYRGWLADHPRDVEAWTELGALYEEQSKFDAALSALRTVLRIEPANLDARKEIADIQISLRQFREAFDFYHTLPEEQHDPATLENYALLAESLADYGAFNRALVLRQHRLKSPTTQDFLELARSFEVIGDTDGLLRCYQGGLRQFPKSRILKIELAGAYRKMGAYDEAVALLAVPQLKSDMHAMQLFIEVACLKEDYQFALAFLGQGFENHFAFGPETRLDLGHIYFNNGYLKEADELYSSVPDEPALWPLLASARFKRGDFASAEKYQRKHLAALQVPDAQGWLFLGDILKSQGREAEANQAYAKSLQLMEDKIESVSAEPSSELKHASLP